MIRSISRLLLVSSALFASAMAADKADANLPLGLPTDQILPLKLDGFRLVTLDRTKEVVFSVEGKKVTVEIPLFVYLPDHDYASEMKTGLKAVHSSLAAMASSTRPVEPAQLMTLFLALDRVMKEATLPVETPPKNNPAPVKPPETSTPSEQDNVFEQASRASTKTGNR